ncbi:MAG: GMC family oxidoreductase [Chloroflexota bacterium]|nr:GMC family oxidoreductase [Chloroflexota bacterium]
MSGQQGDLPHADVLVVGAGPAGAIASQFLAQSGVKVVCLEQGDRTDPRDYPGDKVDSELLEQRAWHPDPDRRGREADYPIDVSESEFSPQMFAAVGGSTILYRGHWPRFLPSDFRVRTLDGVADDWPFTYEDLEPYYDLIDVEVGVAGLAGDTAYPPTTTPLPMPPHPFNVAARRVAAAHNRLGWHWWPGPNAIASRDYRNLKACVHYGTCISGCPNGSKSSFELTVWPEALKYGARLVTGARVSEITTNAAGLATGALWIDRQGVRHRQTADVVILAANSIGNARLLFLSATSAFPHGLANSSGLVGTRLMTHPFASVLGTFDEDFRSWEGPYGQSIQSMEFYETDTSRGFVRGAKWGLLPTNGPLVAALAALAGRDPVMRLSDVRERIGHSAQWGILVEDLPHESNRVVLSDTVKDSDGIPAPKVIARDDDVVKRNLAFQVERAKESLQAAGALKTYVGLGKPTRSHNIGTTKMGNDPTTSVVDQYCRSHDVPNLYIFGASVFPTAAAVNPTPTLCAVTLRAVEHLVGEGRLQPVPA